MGLSQRVTELLERWLGSLLDWGINPRTINIDSAGKEQHNTAFGDAVIGLRNPSVANQFMYGTDFRKVNSVFTGTGEVRIEDESLFTASTGAQTNSSVSTETRQVIRYVPGYECYIMATVIFSSPKNGSVNNVGLWEPNNGFWLGYNTNSEFGFMRLRNGVEYWTSWDNWDTDVINGKNIYNFILNPQKGNVYKMSYGYLGFANVILEVYTQENKWLKLHTLKFANESTVSHIANTYLPIRGYIANTTNDTEITFKLGSVCAGIVYGGGKYVSSRKFSETFPEKATGTNTMLVMMRAKSTYYNKTNFVSFLLERISVSADGAQNVTIELIKNMTITNTPSWTDKDTLNSIFEHSTDATVTPGTGEQGVAFELSKTENLKEQIDYLDIEIYPGDTLTIFVNGNNNIKVSVNWTELF